MRRLALAAALALASAGCGSSVTGTAAATAAPGGNVGGAVQIRAVSLPREGRELGIVQATSRGEMIHELAPELARQVAALGGNFGLVDRVSSRFEIITHMETYSYPCGRTTCFGSRFVEHEVETVTMIGRAFWVPP